MHTDVNFAEQVRNPTHNCDPQEVSQTHVRARIHLVWLLHVRKLERVLRVLQQVSWSGQLPCQCQELVMVAAVIIKLYLSQ